MCVLSKWIDLADNIDGKGSYVPLGRSFGGRDWQLYPVLRNKILRGSGGYPCGEADAAGTDYSSGERLCQVTLPSSSSRLGDGTMHTVDHPYFLTRYEHTDVSNREELSRFLTRTTLGPTTQELDDLEALLAADLSLTIP